MLKERIYAGDSTMGREATLPMIELFRRFKLYNIAAGKSDKTTGWYNEILNLFLGFLETKHHQPDLSCLNTDTVRDYILYLREKPKFKGHPYALEQAALLSPRTIQCHVRTLKVFSSWLHGEGYTRENILKCMKLPKAPKTMVQPLTPEEIMAVFKCINDKSPTGMRNRNIVLCMLDTGMRASEVANIHMGHVNLDGGYIKVMGKGAKERIVPIGKVVQKALWQYINHVRPKPKGSDCDYLFLTTSGRPITLNTVKLMFSRLARASGVSRLHAHLCRHTFAINYLLNGGDIFSLQEILGHTTLEMVRHYLHFTTAQVAALHYKYSPMDKLHNRGNKTSGTGSDNSPCFEKEMVKVCVEPDSPRRWGRPEKHHRATL